MKKTLIAAAIAAAGLAASNSTLAATQGTVGATSEGDLDIFLVIPDLIRINQLADIDFGTYTGDGVDLSDTSDACVRTNGAATYEVTATSNAGSFDLQPADAGTTTTIAYAVEWGGNALTYNASLAAQAADDTSLGGDCTGAADKISVSITGADMDAAQADSYSDTLVLTVSPE